jgi:hypothetical protein
MGGLVGLEASWTGESMEELNSWTDACGGGGGGEYAGCGGGTGEGIFSIGGGDEAFTIGGGSGGERPGGGGAIYEFRAKKSLFTSVSARIAFWFCS